MVAFSSLANTEVQSVNLASEALKILYQVKESNQVTIELIQDIVSRSYFNLRVEDFKSARRTKET